MRSFRRICVYCGSSNNVSDLYKDAAREVGRELAQRGIDLVFGGGRIGLMGVVADTVLAEGGRVYGVIPDKLQELELGHQGCTELFVVDGMHARKMMMAQLSDAFIALPGGWGTLEEIFEATTWTQLNFHHKPVGLLNTDGYYDPILAWIRQAADAGFIRGEHRELLCASGEAGELLDRLGRSEIPLLESWIARV